MSAISYAAGGGDISSAAKVQKNAGDTTLRIARARKIDPGFSGWAGMKEDSAADPGNLTAEDGAGLRLYFTAGA